MNRSEREAAKRRAGESAAATVDDEALVGLGSGSTAAHAIRALGREVDAGLDIEGVPTSFQAREVAVEAGIELTTLDETGGRLDVAIDGADQFAGADLVKGGGGAHAREKVVDTAADADSRACPDGSGAVVTVCSSRTRRGPPLDRDRRATGGFGSLWVQSL